MRHYYLGWDVGGWNCDHNAASRDALVFLDHQANLVGRAWRGNLREQINHAVSTEQLLASVFSLCEITLPEKPFHVTLAIDTPLGFSTAFVQLITQSQPAESIGASQQNPYLFRQTEHFLFTRGLKPLSPIKDMIGSQATKGIHFLAKFAPQVLAAGRWTDGELLTALEGYPSAAKRSEWMQHRYSGYPDLKNDDKNDALWCALLAFCVAEYPEKIVFPFQDTPSSEGWIFVPIDALKISNP